jgi:hypothetical protein
VALGDAVTGLVVGIAESAGMTITQRTELALTGPEPSTAPVDVADKLKLAGVRRSASAGAAVLLTA